MARRTINKLDARTVAGLKVAGRHSDGGGLYLSIDKAGRRRWVFMYDRDGKRTELGLGGGRDLTLANARREATALRAILADGGDPRATRTKIERQTFGEAADAYIEAQRPSWKSAKHAAQWKMTLDVHAAPIRSTRVDAVATADILAVLKPLWQRTPETAERLRGRIERVLDAAKANGLRTGENPARWRGHLDQLLPRRQRLSRGHHSAMLFAEVPAFISALRSREAIAARALEFTILCAARTAETLGARWAEIDDRSNTWVIPAERMKAGKQHRVPLSAGALRLLDTLRQGQSDKAADQQYIFAQPVTGKPLSQMAMSMLLRRMEATVTVHGFRSSFRDWAGETTSFPRDVCEMALAHTIPDKAEAAYRRGDMLERRRDLMKAWFDFVEAGDRTNVIA